MKELAGHVAVVTGAANGIGRATALELAREGMHVAIADIDDAGLEQAAADISAIGVRALPVPTDVRSRDAVAHLADRVYAELGEVRVLHNNAGVGLIEPVESITDEDWHWIMDVNFFSVVNGLQAFLPRMLATTGERHIVNTASMSGLHTTPKLAGYNASKYAVVGLTEALRDEMAEYGIGVSMLCPAVVGTRIMGRSRKLRNMQSRPPAQLTKAPERGDWEEVRVISPEETARIVVRGIKNNEFYLFTHPEDRKHMRDRFDAMSDGFDRAESWAAQQ